MCNLQEPALAVEKARKAQMEPFRWSRANWVRFTPHETRVEAIRPRGARMKARDPWPERAAARCGWGASAGSLPGESLLGLVWSVRLMPGRFGESARLEPASERAVLNERETHGPLGILSRETEATSLAPRWTEPDRMPELRALSTRFVPLQRRYTWGVTGWQSTRVGAGIPQNRRSGSKV